MFSGVVSVSLDSSATGGFSGALILAGSNEEAKRGAVGFLPAPLPLPRPLPSAPPNTGVSVFVFSGSFFAVVSVFFAD